MSSELKTLIKAAVPTPVLDAYRRIRRAVERRANSRRSARTVFSEIYARNLWGGSAGEFCSGAGSTPSQTRAYVAAVRDFIAANGLRTIVDLGCGDYRVGESLRNLGDHYVGIDVVPALIERNRREFAASDTEFRCLDITADDLPPGDLCLVRQVFQHLSNAEISSVLRKLGAYRFVLVTEHHPAPRRLVRPNADKPHGADTRVIDGSAVCLEFPPFNCSATIVLESPVDSPLVAEGETIRTHLVKISP
jgi:SAM-dependent methyltransferase